MWLPEIADVTYLWLHENWWFCLSSFIFRLLIKWFPQVDSWFHYIINKQVLQYLLNWILALITCSLASFESRYLQLPLMNYNLARLVDRRCHPCFWRQQKMTGDIDDLHSIPNYYSSQQLVFHYFIFKQLAVTTQCFIYKLLEMGIQFTHSLAEDWPVWLTSGCHYVHVLWSSSDGQPEASHLKENYYCSLVAITTISPTTRLYQHLLLLQKGRILQAVTRRMVKWMQTPHHQLKIPPTHQSLKTVQKKSPRGWFCCHGFVWDQISHIYNYQLL